MSSEQRVRTMAGWIGVEISRSRVRTPGKAGYGLYRVRGPGSWWTAAAPPLVAQGAPSAPRAWTPYAFRLETIRAAVRNSIDQGRPERPMDLALVRHDRAMGDLIESATETGMVHLTTRWTRAYTGRRDLGVGYDPDQPIGTALNAAAAGEKVDVMLSANGMIWLAGAPPAGSTVRTRQREANAEFQREHLARRRHGLNARHAAKLAHNTATGNETPAGPSGADAQRPDGSPA